MKMDRLLLAAFEIPRFVSPVAFSTYTAVRRLPLMPGSMPDTKAQKYNINIVISRFMYNINIVFT